MTWRDSQRRVNVGGRELIGASFRGMPFFVERVARSGGRRAVVHEFPLADNPYVEDLGRKARVFKVDGYVIGDGYVAQRDDLLRALEDKAGPGELVLPSYDVKRAVCVDVSTDETRTDGGMAVISIVFAEAPTQAPSPTDLIDAPAQVAASADDAVTATKTELEENYSVAGMPSHALTSAETAITQASDAVESVLAPLVKATQELAQFAGRIEALTSSVSSLVRQPADAIDGLREAITGLTETIASSPGAVMDALIDAYYADLGAPVVATTATRARELANQEALIAALRRTFAVEAARLAPLVEYVSIEEATAARDAVAELLDEQAALADDTAYPAIVDLRSQVLRAVPGGKAFASVVTVTRKEPIPTVLLAYQLYGSVASEQDIIDRNGIAHPGFAVGYLKVLSDG